MLTQATVDGITMKVYRSGNVVMICWSGVLTTAWVGDGTWHDFVSGLPRPAFGDTWKSCTVLAAKTRYDARIPPEGFCTMIAREEIASGAPIRESLVYITAS